MHSLHSLSVDVELSELLPLFHEVFVPTSHAAEYALEYVASLECEIDSSKYFIHNLFSVSLIWVRCHILS